MNFIDRISIIIATYRGDDLLKRCLDSLVVACGGRLPETIVVDDAGGLPTTRPLVESYAKYGVRFLEMEKNGGFSGANNLAFPYCTKEFVVLVNSDTVFRQEPFTAMVSFMDSHSKAAVCQGKVVVENGLSEENGRLNDCGTVLSAFGFLQNPGWLQNPLDPVYGVPKRVFGAYGALFMIRHGIVQKLQGRLFYDFFHMFYEETDFCHRVWLLGYEVWYVPTPVIYHAHGATVRKSKSQYVFRRRQMRNNYFSLLTCFGWRGLLTVFPFFEFFSFTQGLHDWKDGDKTTIKSWLWTHWDLLRRIWQVLTVRRQIQKSRVVSDADLFDVIMLPHSFRDVMRALY